MTRLYCELPFNPLKTGAKFNLQKNAAYHTFVLRMKKGDKVTLFNGRGGEYQAEIINIDKWHTEIEILSFSPHEVELPYQLTLAQALPEASKMDWVIEKTVELGVANIVPLTTQRSVVKLSTERAERRLTRWQSIIIAASEQSGRNRLAQISPVMDFNNWILHEQKQPRLLLTPHAKESLSEWAMQNNPHSVSLLIGTEGGFTPQEEELAIAQGAIPLSMGPRILRTETAGIVAIAALNAIWSNKITPDVSTTVDDLKPL